MNATDHYQGQAALAELRRWQQACARALDEVLDADEVGYARAERPESAPA